MYVASEHAVKHTRLFFYPIARKIFSQGKKNTENIALTYRRPTLWTVYTSCKNAIHAVDPACREAFRRLIYASAAIGMRT